MVNNKHLRYKNIAGRWTSQLATFCGDVDFDHFGNAFFCHRLFVCSQSYFMWACSFLCLSYGGIKVPVFFAIEWFLSGPDRIIQTNFLLVSELARACFNGAR